MISRRTFSSRAALFVLGCALQVSGAVLQLKRSVATKLEQIEIGMVFHAKNNPNDEWMVVDNGNYIVRDGARKEINNSRRNKWNVVQVREGLATQEEPTLFCFEFSEIETLNFHFPV